ncbi:MAG: cytochrome P460 family protein [Vicinamibacterales bacterium]
MNRNSALTIGFAAVAWLAILGGRSLSAQDKYTVKVPGGLAFSEFQGYEAWETSSISRSEKVMAVIVGNPAMIAAYKAGIPANGQPVPDGARMAKVHWTPKPNQFFPTASVPGALLNVDFMVKDSKRFGDVGGWGYAVFDYHAASDTFTPGTTAGTPPQGNDARCGVACHTIAKSRDYVFTEYGKR